MKHFIIVILFIVLSFHQGVASEFDSAEYSPLITLGAANDLFQNHQKSDKYFSASFFMEVSHSKLDTKLARKVLLSSSQALSRFSLGLQQNGFTPENLSLFEVDSADRPYAGTLILSYSQYSYTLSNGFKYRTSFRLGVSGPIASVEQVQTSIHRATGSTLPQGWHNQIANSLILQYHASVERAFFPELSHFELGIGAYGEAGSFFNLIGGYGSLKVGWYHTGYLTYYTVDYSEKKATHQWQFYINLLLSGRVVLYDGSLQGGLIPFAKSPYTLSWKDYSHFTPQFIYALTTSYKNFQISYRNSIEIDRFFSDNIFAFGVISISLPLGKA